MPTTSTVDEASAALDEAASALDDVWLRLMDLNNANKLKAADIHAVASFASNVQTAADILLDRLPEIAIRVVPYRGEKPTQYSWRKAKMNAEINGDVRGMNDE
jgi:hypothetical protein